MNELEQLLNKRVEVIFNKKKQEKVKYRINEVSKHDLCGILSSINKEQIILTQPDNDKYLDVHIKISEIIEIKPV